MDYQQPDNKSKESKQKIVNSESSLKNDPDKEIISDNLDSSSVKEKIFSKMVMFAIIIVVIITAIVSIAVFMLIGRSDTKEDKNNSLNTQDNNKLVDSANNNGRSLSYYHSVKDNEEMALAGAHEFGIRGNYLYITSVKDHGLEIMDISDPGNPKHVSAFYDNDQTFMKKPHSVLFKDNYAYISATEDGAIQVFDISDILNIKPVSYIKDDEKLGLKGVHAIAINGNYLYAAGTKDDALEIIDISNPKEIKHVKTIFDNDELSLKGPHSIAFKDKYAYVLTAEEGIEVLNISDPANPVHISSYSKNDHGHKFQGGHDLIISGNNLYTASYVDGLGFFDVTNPEKIKYISEIHPSEENGLMSASDLALFDNNLFAVSEASGGLIMVDVSDINKPLIKDIIFDDGSGTMFLWNGHYVETAGDYVYVAGLDDGFGVVKILK